MDLSSAEARSHHIASRLLLSPLCIKIHLVFLILALLPVAVLLDDVNVFLIQATGLLVPRLHLRLGSSRRTRNTCTLVVASLIL